MPISKYTGREITEAQKKVEDAFRKGKEIERQNGFNQPWIIDPKPEFYWKLFNYRIKPEPEKENLLPWNTDIFNMPGFPSEIIKIYPYTKTSFKGESKTDIYIFPFVHDCIDYNNIQKNTLHRPGTEKILPCPNNCKEKITIQNNNPFEDRCICPVCNFQAPKSSWQKREV